MRVIICHIQMFANNQLIQVYDTETQQPIYAQQIDLNSLPEAICALATQFGVEEVKLHGDTAFNSLWAEEIKTTYALNHNFTTLNVEVI